MKKNKLYSAFTGAALLLVVFLSGCKDGKIEVDESGYLGTYYGNHYLADSVTIRNLIGDQTQNMIYPDTLVITSGSDATDGKVTATSSLLTGRSIEVNVTTGEVTPVFIGNLVIISTTLKNSKFNAGSTGTWNDAKTTVNTHLTASVTFTFGSTDIPLSPVIINGTFQKQ